jgi:hypothetical protein
MKKVGEPIKMVGTPMKMVSEPRYAEALLLILIYSQSFLIKSYIQIGAKFKPYIF